jgi:hypothetical protein
VQIFRQEKQRTRKTRQQHPERVKTRRDRLQPAQKMFSAFYRRYAACLLSLPFFRPHDAALSYLYASVSHFNRAARFCQTGAPFSALHPALPPHSAPKFRLSTRAKTRGAAPKEKSPKPAWFRAF